MTDKRFAALLPIITAGVIDALSKEYGWSEDEAIGAFHSSELYSYLERENTKVWQYSTPMLLELFAGERRGELVFPEV